MAENKNRYDLILQNSASRSSFVFTGLEDLSENALYFHFDLDLGLEEGEYTYCVLLDMRDDTEFDLRIPLMDTIVHTEDGDVVLRDLQPVTGLLRVGKHIEEANIYDNTAYTGETTDDNNTIFYYEG